MSWTVPSQGSGAAPVVVTASAITASDVYRNICFIRVVLCIFGFCIGCFVGGVVIFPIPSRKFAPRGKESLVLMLLFAPDAAIFSAESVEN